MGQPRSSVWPHLQLDLLDAFLIYSLHPTDLPTPGDLPVPGDFPARSSLESSLWDRVGGQGVPSAPGEDAGGHAERVGWRVSPGPSLSARPGLIHTRFHLSPPWRASLTSDFCLHFFLEFLCSPQLFPSAKPTTALDLKHLKPDSAS